jgi:hypothetical protein
MPWARAAKTSARATVFHRRRMRSPRRSKLSPIYRDHCQTSIEFLRISVLIPGPKISGLDLRHRERHHRQVCRPDGRSRYGRKATGEESPGSIDIRCRIVPDGGDARDSATENKPLAFALRGFGAPTGR